MYDYTYERRHELQRLFAITLTRFDFNKNGTDYDYRGLTDACQVTWIFPPDDPEWEWDTSVLTWNPEINYKFRLEWGPLFGGYTPCKVFRNDVIDLAEEPARHVHSRRSRLALRVVASGRGRRPR